MSTLSAEELGRLLDRYAAALELYARQWTTASADVVQDAFMRLLQQTPPPEDAVAWLYVVVRNRALNSARGERRRQRREREAATETPWFEHTPEDGLDAELAQQALRSLPDDQREPIVARLWGGLSFEQIASLTGVSASTAHRRYQAGVLALRERLGVTCQNENDSLTG